MISRLLPALNQCSEWGQVFILDALAMYEPPNGKVAEAILEKGVVATLHHHNSAVVLSAIKVIMKFMDRLSSQELVRSVCRKMTPPLLTMLSAEPEIQYVVMRNINLIVQKQPNMLQTDVRGSKHGICRKRSKPNLEREREEKLRISCLARGTN